MLFQIVWKVMENKRVDCMNVFARMGPDDDAQDCGNEINVVGRWHHLSGSGGVCIAECASAEALNAWLLNWAPVCNIEVHPVVQDAEARANIQSKPWFIPEQE